MIDGTSSGRDTQRTSGRERLATKIERLITNVSSVCRSLLDAKSCLCVCCHTRFHAQLRGYASIGRFRRQSSCKLLVVVSTLAVAVGMGKGWEEHTGKLRDDRQGIAMIAFNFSSFNKQTRPDLTRFRPSTAGDSLYRGDLSTSAVCDFFSAAPRDRLVAKERQPSSPVMFWSRSCVTTAFRSPRRCLQSDRSVR